ncbi:MAG: hypothetical protein OEW87_12830 [Flavobacteriaceae bacterium]|nr:hypothetical protein [Flavobacteriaceae bacterium]
MKFIKKLITKTLDYLESHISDAPQNITHNGRRYTHKERPIDDLGKKEISDDVKCILQQREALGMRSSKNPLDDKDEAIQRATDKYWRKREAEAKQNALSRQEKGGNTFKREF